MIQPLRTWLNGSRDYRTGISIYERSQNPDSKLLMLFRRGKNESREKRLLDELLNIYNKTINDEPDSSKHNPGKRTDTTRTVAKKRRPEEKTTANVPERLPNQNLYEKAKGEASEAYKRVMNMRAVLFSLARQIEFADVNHADRVAERTQMAIDVVTGFQKVSQLYDRADFVAKEGYLPETDEQPDDEYDNLPDYLVKSRLDNLRKAYNKLKKKQPTAHRLQQLQRHEQNIQKLLKRWHSLKPVT